MPHTLRLTIALQYLAVVIGVAWGRGAHSAYLSRCEILDEWWLFGALAVVLIIVAAYRDQPREVNGVRSPVLTASSGMAAYAVSVMAFDPFSNGCPGDLGLLIGVGVCLVPLLAVKQFVRFRSWLALGGDVLFGTVCIACMFDGFSHFRGGNGFSLPRSRCY